MNAKFLPLIALLLLGLSLPARAHPTVDGHVTIGDGPVTLGIHLGRWVTRGHAHRHVHGPACYRRYERGHAHWSHHRHQRAHPRFRDRHADHQAPRHRGRHRGHHPPRYGQTRQAFRHRHNRDCHLHYPHGHEHWRR